MTHFAKTIRAVHPLTKLNDINKWRKWKWAKPA